MSSFDLTRRAFVAGSLATLAAPFGARAAHHEKAGLPVAALETSPYVYVSPLKRDGTESRCHGEIWFAWLDGEVVSSTASDRWKATAIATGRTRTRIWVGDHGRWRGGKNEAFRQAPKFDAVGRTDDDPALLERILAVYARKYPKEISRWADKMRRELASGERVLLRYRPEAS